MIRFFVLALGSGLPAWWAWTLARDYGLLAGFLSANVAFAVGWYVSRKFIHDHLDLS